MSDEIKPVVVQTEGEAFLRNGFSKVAGLSVESTYAGDVQISAINSRGTETSGWIRVKPEDFADLCRRFLEENPQFSPNHIEID